MRRWLWLAALCLLAFGLSCAYLEHYLRGGPRIIDATSYWLEARSLSQGAFTFQVPDPSAAFRGRFLLASPDGHRLGVIFPPGYPLVLALGVLAGAPLLVGPILGALLVAVTYALARALEQTTTVALVAAVLSALCAALRYHTADTMSHGLATLLACGALTAALRRDIKGSALMAGLCLGLLGATRPVSALPALLLCGYVLRTRGPRAWLTTLVGTLPGVLLLAAQQRALTGSFFGSPQLAYYAVSDAPGGCFRYGFGAGVGCRYEHGEYVARYLPHGYGLWPALRNFGVRLSGFVTDATNAAPLTLLGGYALWRHARSRLWLLGAGILLQALAYVPFYFDGNYPGGGARFLCEAIPLAQLLVARALCDLRLGWLAPVGALAGFALYARHGHEALREREGGRPMFEPAVVKRAGVTRGLLFVDTDHGFNLGYEPRAHGASAALTVARLHRDAHDRELFEQLGRPPTYRYAYDFAGRVGPQVLPYTPARTLRREAEAEWPTLLEQGHAYPIHRPCASAGRALRLKPGTRAAFELPLPPGASGVALGWVGTAGPAAAPSRVRAGWDARSLERSDASLARLGSGCVEHLFVGRPPSPGARFHVELESGDGALDYLEPR